MVLSVEVGIVLQEVIINAYVRNLELVEVWSNHEF